MLIYRKRPRKLPVYLQKFLWKALLWLITVTCSALRGFRHNLCGRWRKENGLRRRPKIVPCPEKLSTWRKNAQNSKCHRESSCECKRWKEILLKTLSPRDQSQQERRQPCEVPSRGCTVIWGSAAHTLKKENATMSQQNQASPRRNRPASQQRGIQEKLKDFAAVYPWHIPKPDKRKTEEEVLRRRRAYYAQIPWVVPELIEKKRKEELSRRKKAISEQQNPRLVPGLIRRQSQEGLLPRKSAIYAQNQDCGRQEMLAWQERRRQGQQILARLQECNALIDHLWEDDTTPGGGGNILMCLKAGKEGRSESKITLEANKFSKDQEPRMSSGANTLNNTGCGDSWRNWEALDVISICDNQKEQPALASRDGIAKNYEKTAVDTAALRHSGGTIECRAKSNRVREQNKPCVSHDTLSANGPKKCPFFYEIHRIFQGDARIHQLLISSRLDLRVALRPPEEACKVAERSVELLPNHFTTSHMQDILSSMPAFPRVLPESIVQATAAHELVNVMTTSRAGILGSASSGGEDKTAKNTPGTPHSPANKMKKARKRKRTVALLNKIGKEMLQYSKKVSESVDQRHAELLAAMKEASERADHRFEQLMEETQRGIETIADSMNQCTNAILSAVQVFHTLCERGGGR